MFIDMEVRNYRSKITKVKNHLSQRLTEQTMSFHGWKFIVQRFVELLHLSLHSNGK